VDGDFHSVALNENLSTYVYLPIGYFDQPQRRYPTIYLLSGGGGNLREWVQYGVCLDMDRLIRDETIQPMIVVMPSGNDNPMSGLGSYWFNHAPPPLGDGKRWGDYIAQDLVRYVDSNYRTLPDRSSRAIGGLSAGGQGALTAAFTHP
jgi:S-formylglutathione hydrolase FrmB